MSWCCANSPSFIISIPSHRGVTFHVSYKRLPWCEVAYQQVTVGHWQQHFDKGLEYVVKMVVPIQLEDAKADIISTQGRFESRIADGDALEFHWINLIFWEAPEGQDLITCFRVKAERESDISRYNSKQLWGSLAHIFALLLMLTSLLLFQELHHSCNENINIKQFTWQAQRAQGINQGH